MLISWIPQVHVTARLIVVILALLIALPALADNRKDCKSTNSERSDKACSAIIKEGREGKKTLAIAYTNRGNSYLKKGEYDDAIADFDKAIGLNPKYADAYGGRGAVYNNKGEYGLAITDYNQAIVLKPKYVDAYGGRGVAHAAKGNYDLAIADYDKTISLDSKYSVAYGNRGLAYASKGNHDQAIADYDMAISLDPKFTLAHYRRGLAYAAKDDYDHAIEAFDTAISFNPENSEAYGNRGLVYIKKGDYDRGIADLDKAISLDPKIQNSYNQRGFAYYTKGDYGRAIADYDKAISLDPKYGVAYYNRGEAQNKKGDSRKALADLRQAIANMPPTDSESGKAQKLIGEIEQELAEAAAAAAKAELAKKQAKAAADATTLLKATEAARKRVALVIGNSAYEFAEELPNPSKDAQAMGQLLSAMGFKVIKGTNLTKPEFETKIKEFSTAAKTAELSLFFYAGHGLQVAGKNYLFPVDAKVESDNALNVELINVEAVTDHMGGDKKAGIVLLDASQKNPFLNSLAQSLGEARAMSISEGLAAIFGTTRAALVRPGLAAISAEGKGLVFGYAAAPGDVAAGGGNINSPFTTALLKRLPMKGTELREILKQVKADVIEATDNAQQPWTNSDLSSEVYLQTSN